jgi:chromosome segregation ATPase
VGKEQASKADEIKLRLEISEQLDISNNTVIEMGKKIEQLTQDYTRQTVANKALESNKQDLVDKLEGMTEESKRQTAANKALESEKDDLTLKVGALEGEKEQLTLHTKDLTYDLGKAEAYGTTVRSDVEAELKALESKVHELEETKADVCRNLVLMQSQMSAMTELNNKRHEESEEKHEVELKTASTRMTAMKIEFDEQLRKLGEEYRSIQLELEAATEERDTLKVCYQQLDRDMAGSAESARKEMKRLKEQIDRLTGQKLAGDRQVGKKRASKDTVTSS